MVELRFHQIIKQVTSGARLSREQAEHAFLIIMNGGATPAQIAAFLVALKIRGETADEIAGGANVLRVKAQNIKAPFPVMDTCGTGGDAKGSYNISTTVAFVLAACGVPVAKHGNRSVSSKSGSADVLEALGIKTDAPLATIETCLRELGICFIYAPQFHSAMRHVSLVRQELGVRTVFNLLGPLANPARPAFQLLGVYDRAWLEPMAHVLKQLKVSRAWVVHGADGMDEISLSGETYVAELKEGAVTTFTITPEDAGLTRAPGDALRGDDAGHNAQAMREVLLGGRGAYRDAVLLNAAAGLIISGKSPDLKAGATTAAEAIDSGLAYKKLQLLIDMSHQKN